LHSRLPLAQIAFALTLLFANTAHAASGELVLGVEPLLSEAETLRQFQPVCVYLAAVTQRPCRVATRPNFLSYWETMRRGKDYNLILDDAHFTDYRAQKMGYTVLAKIPDTVTYSLIVPRTEKRIDPTRLIGRRIATHGIPSMGAAQLNGLFPQPSKQPIPVEVNDAEEGFTLLREGNVAAAILPTPLVREALLRGMELRVLLSTVPIPHMAMSASPELEPALRQAVREALLGAHKSESGQKMLTQLGIPRFDPANGTVYRGQARILQDYWGY